MLHSPAPTRITDRGIFQRLPVRAHPVYRRATYEAPFFPSTPEDAGSTLLGALLRTLWWIFAGIELAFWLVSDFLRGSRTTRDRGIRFRQLFERMGGTAIKIGQQLSVRIDLLPFDVCDELSKLQDRVPPFHVDYAIKCFEGTTGRRLEDVFRVFDPVPIGSASIACVYQAYLRTGERVAVKIRRPGIVEKFATDLRFIDWMTYIPELLAVVKWGFFRYLRAEIRSMLCEELDFDREARYQRLFRREAKRCELWWLTAPKVYSEFCNTEVLVSEFASGIWCRELLDAVESRDPKALEYVESLKIKPKEVARRLLYTQFWSSYEALFFHADPHPSNIVVQQDGVLVFLDFGSCGTTSRKIGRSQRQVLDAMARNDLSSMVESALRLLEPLPPLDVHRFKKTIGDTYQRMLLAVRDNKSEWWERTTMILWMTMLQATKEFKLPLNIDVIRQFRCSILYDTLAYRIDPSLNLVRIYRRYHRDAAERTARRAVRQRGKVTRGEQRNRAVERAGGAIDTMERASAGAEEFLVELPIRFQAAINKGAYTASLVLNFILHITFLIVAAATGLWLWRLIRGQSGQPLSTIFLDVAQHRAFLAVAVTILTCILLRRVLFRLAERDTQATRRLR